MIGRNFKTIAFNFLEFTTAVKFSNELSLNQ